MYLLSKIFEQITSFRNFLYDKNIIGAYRSRFPVISIGNISVGGSGKTPLAIYIAKELAARGYKPAILTRGYGGTAIGPTLVEGSPVTEIYGDEAIMMYNHGAGDGESRIFNVVVSRSRAEGARKIEEKKWGDIIILDDGLQHRRIARDINIVNINVSSKDAVDDLLGNKILPFGTLRENARAALRRADLVVLSNRGNTEANFEESLKVLLPEGRPVFKSSFEITEVLGLLPGNKLEAKEVTAFCAIANPAVFFDSLLKQGFKILQKSTFNDHHKYDRRDLLKIKCDFPDSPVVCTEKDAVKLSELNIEKNKIFYLAGKAKVERPEEFSKLIVERIQAAR